MQATEADEESLVGDVCHIVSQSEDGPRGQSSMGPEERDSYGNLILLCKVHHKLVDDQWRTYTVERLLQMKEQHERWVRESLPEFGLERVEDVSAHRELDVPPARVLYRGINELRPDGTASHPAWEAYNGGDFRAAIPELEAWTRQHPDDAAGWEALAWAEYNCFRYPEALRSIGIALATGRASDEALYIRACILAEDGIERGDRASLLQANELFRKRATDRGEWVDHYNYGNTLAALDQHAAAKESYLAAIEQDERHPQVWKNLASTYHLLGDHTKEMECFDRVLALDPDHPQGLTSKGVSLLVDMDDAAGAIPLLRRAVEVAPDLGIRWPTIWYWLAAAESAAGETANALRTVTHGLDLAPSNPWLRDLKARLLAWAWRSDSGYRDDAIAFFEFMVQLAPYAYDHRSQLVELYEAVGQEDRAWQLLDDAFALVGLNAERSLRESPLSLNEVRRSLHFLANYARFRSHNPVRIYWNVEDPLYVDGGYSGAPPPLSAEAERILVQFSAVAFGLGCEVLHEARDSDEDVDCLRKMVESLYRPLILVSATVSLDLLVSISSDGEDRFHFISVLELPDFVGFVMFRELCRQSAHIRMLFDVADPEALVSLQSSEFLAGFQMAAALSLQQMYDALVGRPPPTGEDS